MPMHMSAPQYNPKLHEHCNSQSHATQWYNIKFSIKLSKVNMACAASNYKHPVFEIKHNNSFIKTQNSKQYWKF